jgi:hypothetical protein
MNGVKWYRNCVNYWNGIQNEFTQAFRLLTRIRVSDKTICMDKCVQPTVTAARLYVWTNVSNLQSLRPDYMHGQVCPTYSHCGQTICIDKCVQPTVTAARPHEWTSVSNLQSLRPGHMNGQVWGVQTIVNAARPFPVIFTFFLSFSRPSYKCYK